MMLVSVIIPTYNRKQLLNKAIKSVLNQTYQNFEIIIIDDNSNDGTKDILKKINLNNKNFSFYVRTKTEKGLSQSLIYGIKKSIFKNIIVMDGDLQHNPKYLPIIIKIFFNKKIDFLVCVRDFRKRYGLSLIRYAASLLLIFFVNALLGKRVSDPMSGFFIFKKKIYLSNKKNIYGKGFKLLLDLIYSSKKMFKIYEYKIIFDKRKNNKSKMNFIVIYHILIAIFYNLFRKILS